jgi:hypothetical protein
MSANNVTFPTISIPSRMRYYVTFILLMFLMYYYDVYESRPRAFIITLGNKMYRIPKITPPTTISLVTTKQCSKLIAKTRKFVFLMIQPQGKKKTVVMTSRLGPSPRQQ